MTGTWIHLIAFLGVAAAVLWAWIGRWDLFVLAMAVIIFEKYFDDDQRVLVYKKLYYQWIMNFSARIIFPSIVLVVAVVIFGKNSVAYYVAAEAAGMTLYVLCYQTQFFRASYRVVRRAWRLSRFGMFRQYAGNYVKEYSIAQIWSFLTINCIMVDRFFVNMQSPSIFAEYIFAVNLANTIQTFHNLGYVSFLRPHLMKASTSGMSAQFAPMNFLVPLALTAVMLIVFHGSQAVGYPLSRLDAPLFWGVCGLYFLHAVSLVVKELAFWRLRRGVLLAQELVVYVFPVAAYLAGATSPSVYVMSALAGVAMRFGILILLVRRAEKPGSRLVIRSAFH